MKKIIVCIAFLVTILCLCACRTIEKEDSINTFTETTSGNSIDNTETDNKYTGSNTKNKEIVYKISTNSDYNKLAKDFDELVSDSDLILKIRVENIRAFVGDNGMIQTEITPKVQNVYKGSYDNQKLYVNGGEMLYDEFCKNEIIKKALSGHENPNNDKPYGKYVRQSVDEQYIFNIGEEYIFFANKREDSGRYYSLYAYQGTYKIIDGIIENVALNDDEPLKNNLNEIFSNKTESKSTQTFLLKEEIDSGKITTEEVFIKRMNTLK